MRFVRLPALLLLFAGCADDTAILLEVRAEEGIFVPATLDELRIRALGLSSGKVSDRLFLPAALPETLAILPGEGSSGEEVLITVEGRKRSADGSPSVVRVKRGVRVQFVAGETVNATVTLGLDCLDVSCPAEGDYCMSGACVGDVTPPVDMGTPDLGPDPVDLGPIDLGPDPVDLGPDPGDLGPEDLGPPLGFEGMIISEYVEPSSGNLKAIEIYNGTGGPVSLTQCQLELYRNGGAVASPIFSATGMLAAGGTFVFCHSELAGAMPTRCDTDEGLALNHNGNEGYGLRCGGDLVDSLGATTGDPGAGGWSAGAASTVDATLRRECPPTPDTDMSDAFDPSADWIALPANTFDGLGARSCPGSP